MRAQTPVVTLSTNGELKSFAANEVADAIYEANPNDTIWLSPGYFEMSTVGGVDGLKKPLVLIGSGATGDSETWFRFWDPEIDLDANSSVVFEGMIISSDYSVQVRGNGNITFRNCKLSGLVEGSDSDITPSVWLDRCEITGSLNLNTKGALNVNNSKIKNVYGTTYTYLVNCYIYGTCDLHNGTVSNSLLFEREDYNNYTTYQDCVIFGFNGPTSAIWGQYINCSPSLNENGEAIQATPENAELYNWLGSDGTLVGPYGGTTPFSLLPSYPTPDPSNSTLEYDKNTHKLKVKVSILDD
ncbi:MAG: hypothetical protein HDS22_05755 [Bacteroides sp.]|nr:hypothetical protein [Bacteroides sp.]